MEWDTKLQVLGEFQASLSSPRDYDNPPSSHSHQPEVYVGSTARFRQVIFKSKAVLCVLLVLNLHAWIAGCTGPAEITAPLSGIVRIELSPDHALTKALNNSVLIGAEAFEIDPVRKSFRVIFAEANREVTGTYAVMDGAFTITEFTFGRFGRSVTMGLDLSKRVRTIVTDDGFSGSGRRTGRWLSPHPMAWRATSRQMCSC